MDDQDLLVVRIGQLEAALRDALKLVPDSDERTRLYGILNPFVDESAKPAE